MWVWSSPLVVIPKKSGGVRITHCVNYYMKLNKISSLSHLHIPRVDQVLDSLGKRQVFPCSAWFLRSIRLPPTRIPFLSRRFGTPAGLYERLVMPQGSSASPVWCVKVIDDAIKDLEQVSAYLDDVIALDSDPMAYVKTMRTLFERLCKHNNLNFSPSNARPIGVTRGGPEEGPEGRPSCCKASSGTHMSGAWATPRVSLGPSAYKCIGRGVRNFDNVVWDRVCEEAVPLSCSALAPRIATNDIRWYLP